jgi:carbon-monoxide dehydrogenase medium subunit
MKDFEYYSPSTLTEACELLKKYNGSARILAGGTDIIPQMYHKKIAPGQIINIKRIPKLNDISFDPSKGLSFGALVRFNDLIFSETVQANYPILVEISKLVASHQVRNLATVGGNLSNAAPSADSAPILIALDSKVLITGSGSASRELPLSEFFTGPGETALSSDEILTQINVPPIPEKTGIAYIKHTIRNALEIAVVGVAGLIQLDEDTNKCTSARVVIGACAPTPLRISRSEEILVGSEVTPQRISAAATASAEAVAPITDVRGSEAYRREMVRVQTKRVLEAALSRVPFN